MPIIAFVRTVYAILLTGLICLNLFGFYAIFILKQAEIKDEMSESINRANSTNFRQTLVFSRAAFSSLTFNDNGKELLLEGKLYDVVSINKTDGQTQVTVEYDAKETGLMAAFTDIIGQQQDRTQNSSPLKTIISHFQQDYVTSGALGFGFYNACLHVFPISDNTNQATSFVANNLTPPPQFFLV